MFSHKIKLVHYILTAFAATTLFSACIKEPDDFTDPVSDDNAKARIEITDGPVDDANVNAVFITVADIKVDGKSWSGFTAKTTFDISALRNGATKLLAEGGLKAGSYNQITLVLDTETDASGKAPGCYVLDSKGAKKRLEGGSNFAINLTGNLTTYADSTSAIVIDFDLRKSIVYEQGSTTDYTFVPRAEMSSALRMVTLAGTGKIKGKCNDGVSDSDKIIVYAYQKGTYTSSEYAPQGTSNISFKNAVTSTVVAGDGTFQLSFLEKGDYELHFISYRANASGTMQAKGELQLNMVGSLLNLLNIGVSAEQQIDLNVTVTGITFF